MIDGRLERIGIVEVLDTLRLVTLRRKFMYNYSDSSLLLII